MSVPIQGRIACLKTASDLAALGDAWDALAHGAPFCRRDWLATWWRVYADVTAASGRTANLCTVAVYDRADALVGVAPWYLDESSAGRRVIRSLGGGEVCSDYLGILCRPGCEPTVAAALAQWLLGSQTELRAPADGIGGWDLLELSGMRRDDPLLAPLAQQVALGGGSMYRRPGANCWQVPLPATWEAYVRRLSKSHRKQVRRFERRMFDTGRARLRRVESKAELGPGLTLLMQLHQRRRESLGERGCFASARFAAFLAEVSAGLLRDKALRLYWLELDGEPVAAEYHIRDGSTVYAYQSGIDPNELAHQPGQLITLATLREAIAEGAQTFDFLRGDEAYKAHWRAAPQPSWDLRITPSKSKARLRHSLWVASDNVKTWIKSGLKRSGMRG